MLTQRFIQVRDQELKLNPPPWISETAYEEAFEMAHEAWYASQPDRIKALMVFSSFDEGGGELFYLPMANDISGLGAAEPASIFDDTPGMDLDGYIWMGNLKTLEDAGDLYLEEAFIHELAHRWSAYPQIDHPQLPADALLGRMSTHWSFLAHSENSVMEGNDWKQTINGDWYTHFANSRRPHFSPLDLYLMGVLPPQEVPPFPVVVSWDRVTPGWYAVDRAGPPAKRVGEVATLIGAQTVEVRIEDIIAGSGPRIPAARAVSPEDPVVWPIGVVLLSDIFHMVTLEELQQLQMRLEQMIEAFEEATGGRIKIELQVLGAGQEALGAECSTIYDCDRTVANACAALPGQTQNFCTARCESSQACGPSHCCVAGVCVTGSECGTPPPPPPPTMSAPDAGPKEALALDPESDGCLCVQGESSPSIGLGLWFLLGALGLLRSAGVRRGSPGNLGASQTRRHPRPRSSEAE